jgi:hypothetical protein
MRFVVGLLACLSAGALTSALADPPADQPATAPAAAAAAPTAPAASAAPASPAAAATATPAAAPAARPAIDFDTQHFVANGYKPEMRHGEQVYCKRETALGSRVNAVKTCGTIAELKLMEQRTKQGLQDTQRQQVGIRGN